MSTAQSTIVRDLVALVFRDGHTYGARPRTASRTLTIDGKRRIRIRVQSDICRLMMRDGRDAECWYPDLAPAIREAISEQRA